MWSRQISQLGSYSVYRFLNTETNSGFSVVPERGGCLTEIQFKGISVLDGYRDIDELETLDFGKSALLAPFPNRLRDGKYQLQGKEYRFPINEPARNNTLHGFVMDKPFEVADEGEDHIALEYIYAGGFSYYPFPFVLRVRYSMASAASFEVQMELKNTGTRSMPAGLGWHPYFQLGAPMDSISMKLPPVDRIEIDSQMIPTGERTPFPDFQHEKKIGDTPFDNGFFLTDPGVRSEVRLQFEDLRLLYWQESVFSFLQVFIPPDRQCIALEPMTCNIDAFNNGEGLKMLEPGESLGGNAGVVLF